LLTAIFVAVALASVKTAAADPTVDAKRAQAQDVLRQIEEMDGQLGQAIESYNLANVKLDAIRGDLKANARHLVVAQSSLKNAQSHLSERLVSLYVNGTQTNALEVLLGAESLDDLLNRMDAVERVSDQDARVVGEVRSFRTQVKQRKSRLERARTSQAQVVADRASQRRSIEGQLAERERMLTSIKSEIASLQAAERLRQQRLASQARARVAQTRARVATVQSQAETTPEAQTPAFEEQPIQEIIAPAPASAPAARYGGAVGIAMQYLGIPYLWGGATPATGFDCSGFTMYVFAQLGVSLPHHAATQYGMGTPVSKEQLQPGDLVFFNGLGHMGMYIGGGQFIHSPRTGDVVKISSLSDSWYARTWVGARRL